MKKVKFLLLWLVGFWNWIIIMQQMLPRTQLFFGSIIRIIVYTFTILVASSHQTSMLFHITAWVWLQEIKGICWCQHKIKLHWQRKTFNYCSDFSPHESNFLKNDALTDGVLHLIQTIVLFGEVSHGYIERLHEGAILWLTLKVLFSIHTKSRQTVAHEALVRCSQNIY